jgi:hypothetical protein
MELLHPSRIDDPLQSAGPTRRTEGPSYPRKPSFLNRMERPVRLVFCVHPGYLTGGRMNHVTEQSNVADTNTVYEWPGSAKQVLAILKAL